MENKDNLTLFHSFIFFCKQWYLRLVGITAYFCCNYYCRVEQSGSSLGSCPKGRQFKSDLCYYPYGNLKEKEGIFILLITKKTAQILNKEYKVPFGYEGISVSGTRRKYYLTENKYNLDALKALETKNK